MGTYVYTSSKGLKLKKLKMHRLIKKFYISKQIADILKYELSPFLTNRIKLYKDIPLVNFIKIK